MLSSRVITLAKHLGFEEGTQWLLEKYDLSLALINSTKLQFALPLDFLLSAIRICTPEEFQEFYTKISME